MIRLLASVGSFEPVGARNEQEHFFFPVPDLLCLMWKEKLLVACFLHNPCACMPFSPDFFFSFSCWVVKDHVSGSHAHLVWFPPPFYFLF